MIRITAKKDGFRRAGLAHSGVKEYPDDHFTEHQMLLLCGEPRLVVEVVQGKGGAEGAPNELGVPDALGTPDEPGATDTSGEGQPPKKSTSGKKGQ